MVLKIESWVVIPLRDQASPHKLMESLHCLIEVTKYKIINGGSKHRERPLYTQSKIRHRKSAIDNNQTGTTFQFWQHIELHVHNFIQLIPAGRKDPKKLRPPQTRSNRDR